MRTQRVVVVGGGVAGLSAAYRIRGAAARADVPVDVLLLEAGRDCGGKIASVRSDGFLCETGPNGFLDNEPATLRLIHDLGLTKSLLRSNDSARRRFVVRGGRLHELHMNPVKFMSSPLLSLRGRLRMVGEYWVRRRRDDADESVGDFGRRRLGAEFTSIMLDSMVSGIYAGDVDRLSVKAAFPKVVEMEQSYGGLLRAMFQRNKERRARRSAQASQGSKPAAEDRPVQAGPSGVLHSFIDGMGAAITALQQALGEHAVHREAEVVRLESYGARGGYRLHRADGETVDADAVVLALPAPIAGRLLKGLADGAATALGEIEIAGVHVVCTGYRNDSFAAPLEGFGALVPRREGIRSLGSIFSSSTFDGRAPEGHSLLTSMVGGAHDPAANDLDDEQLVRLVRSEMEPLLGIESEPVFQQVFRWARGIPQYNLGHLERIDRAQKDIARHAGLFVGGNSVAGVSFNQCIAHAERLAEDVLGYLRQGASSTTATSDHAEEGAGA